MFLVLAAKNDLAKKRNNGGITEPNCVMELVKISGLEVTPYCEGNDVGTIISKFKLCKEEAPTWLLVGTPKYIDAMTTLVETDYKNALNHVITWARTFLDLKKNGDWLCKALLELVYFDKEIDDSEKIYAGPEGELMSFQELYEADEIHAQSFLLGLWQYIVKSNRANKPGDMTIDSLRAPGKEKSGRGVSEMVGKRCGFRQSIRILKLEKTLLSSEDTLIAGDRDASPEYDRPLIPGVNKMIAFSDEDIALPDHDYDEYLDSVYDKYKEVGTLFYHKEPKPFDSIYICNDVLRPGYAAGPMATLVGRQRSGNYIENINYITLNESRYQYLIITGTGGLGKSMMMTHLLLDAVEHYYEYRILPLLVQLRDFSSAYSSFFDFLFDIFDSFGGGISKEQFEKLLCAGRFMLLLDGIDEIAAKNKKLFETSLDRFINGHRRNYFIMSCRPNEEIASYSRFKKTELLPLSFKQSVALVNKLDMGAEYEPLKQSFISTIETLQYSHKEFIENPLLLTMMLMTYKQKNDIPSEMHKFYAKVYDTLFSEHDNTKVGYKREYKTKLNQDRFAEYFEEFCFLTYQDENYDPSADECKQYFNDMVLVQDEHPEFSWKDFMDDLVDCVCLMYEEGQKYHFIHRSIQEFFCACYFNSLPDSTLSDIGDFFEKTSPRKSDKTFEMLYAMKEKSVKEMIFIPFLKDICTAKGDDEDAELELYVNFLYKIYPHINFNIGDVNDWGENETTPDSYLYRFIAEKAELLTEPKEITLPIEAGFDYEMFVEEEYVLYDQGYTSHEIAEDWVVLEHGDDYDIVPRDEVPREYIEEFGNPEVCGTSYSVPVKELIESNDYDELTNELLSENYPLRVEFENIRMYYMSLLEQKETVHVNLKDKLRRRKM